MQFNSMWCFLSVCLLSACVVPSNPGQPTNPKLSQYQQSAIPSGDTSQNSLDWAGVYQGVLPCTDCEGIKTWLLIKYDLSYVLKTTYLGKSDETFKELGNFAWDAQGRSIILGGDPARGARFVVQERRLMQTNAMGEPIESDRPEAYILKQIARLRGPD